MKYKYIALALVIIFLAFGCGKKEKSMNQTDKPTAHLAPTEVVKDHEDLNVLVARAKKMIPIEVSYDPSKYSNNEIKTLTLLVRASRAMDSIFLKQVYSKNVEIKQAIKEMYRQNPKIKPLMNYFNLNFGPFDRLENDKPFINLNEKKLPGANYYPEDITKEEFESHIKANPGDEKNFTSPYTVIVRKDGKLTAVPYSEYYKKDLEKAAQYLRDAAKAVPNPSLKKYLRSRADAFLSNDYFQSDIDWMDLNDHKIEVVIGPYEVYEDGLFNYKAAFESFVSVVDPEESKKMEKVAKALDDMEKNLPVADKYKKEFKHGKSSPILVVDELYTGGEAKCSVQTSAFNLPNDERVRELKGSKKIMLKNVSEAKFRKSLLPIASKALTKKDYANVSFGGYFSFLLMHEVSHGLGPGNIVKDGKPTTVAKELKELNSAIEEAKADILGLWNCLYLAKKGIFARNIDKELYPSYLGGLFRVMRFGANEAHGIGCALQLNYLMEKKGIICDKTTGQFQIDPKNIVNAVKQLATELLEIESAGDYARAKQLLDKYKNIPMEAQFVLNQVTEVPTDILPVFTLDADLKKLEKYIVDEEAKKAAKKAAADKAGKAPADKKAPAAKKAAKK
ncbi:MAG: dipeptidyl-peptidase 3 family protein [Candidatus Omnitrophota bacterium]